MAKVGRKLSQQEIENIKNYGDKIRTIESFMDIIRQSIGMYAGGRGNKGFKTIIREIVQNAIDQMNKPGGTCTHVIISYDERTFMTIVEDNGWGIPFDKMVDIYTVDHTGSNYDKELFEYSSGTNGVGAKLTAALSRSFSVESYRLGEAMRMELVDGEVQKGFPKHIENKENKQGTKITFIPNQTDDHLHLGLVSMTCMDVLEMLRLLLMVSKIGTTIIFNGISIDGRAIHETLVNEDGIIADLILRTDAPATKPITAFLDTGEFRCEFGFTYDLNDILGQESINAFANFCPVSDGIHIKAFLDAVTRFFCTYMSYKYRRI